MGNQTFHALFSNLPAGRNANLRHFRQFVVTNCSKERPGSIVKETLKNGILIPIDISKELDFYADFKYIKFVKFSLTHQ